MACISRSKPLKIRPASKGGGRAMYRFLECTAAQYMTRSVTTVTRQVTMGELGNCSRNMTSIPSPWWKTETCWEL